VKLLCTTRLALEEPGRRLRVTEFNNIHNFCWLAIFQRQTLLSIVARMTTMYM
jgi:hypothetical protein